MSRVPLELNRSEMKAKLIPMPPRPDCYDAWFQEYRERKKYEMELEMEKEKTAAIRGIGMGFLICAAAFALGFAIYWIVRLRT